MKSYDKAQSHSERSHALLSASGASRWLNCTPSARLEEEHGERTSSEYAKEGTLAHELAEICLKRDLGKYEGEEEFEQQLEKIMSNELFDENMTDMVSIYTEYCIGQFESFKQHNPSAIIELEQQLDLTDYIPESFGTADCSIVSDPVLEIVDLKYGKGIPVNAEWNKQLMLYGLGAYAKYSMMFDIEEIRLTIVQPRLDNISTWQISVPELLEWAVSELKPKAEMAFDGQGDLNPGEWCRFCAVRNRCRKLYEQQMEIAKHEFAEPSLLSDEEIAGIVRRTPKFLEWANSIAEYAHRKAISENKSWPGLKLVEGVSRRKWLDEEQAANLIFAKCPELSEDDIFNMKLNSITSIEKLIGKKRFEEVLSEVVVKPQGKPCLVPIEDKRPAMGYDQAKMDFSNNND